VKDATARVLSRFHRIVFRLTRGLIGRRLVDNDMLLLTTIGRRSGTPHTVPLLYLRDDDRLAVIASWGGRDHHPHWYLNLVENPEVVVQEPFRRPRRVRARTAAPEERAVWWPRVLEAYDGYAVYESRTDREIPVVFLEPK
jgi:deazaflavin-dependent oxidoreductase (nitroreductase family)